PPAPCCTRNYKKPIKLENLKNFTIQTDTDMCNINSTIFFTQRNKLICADPQMPWVIRAMNHLKKLGCRAIRPPGAMKEACSGAVLFEDRDFPTADSSLFSDSSTPIARLHGEITWQRPQVLPPGQPQWGSSRYRGSFQFLFWQHGHWTEVTIDDRLPCMNSSLCFSCCHSPSAFWVALLEKAYAK
ncbi:hypothetical protein GOODEAATRI_011279, partial [Goodea atripinnis]